MSETHPRYPPWWAWGLIALILVGAAAVRVRMLEMPLDRDEGEYAYFGQLLLQGLPPYAAAYNFKMPGIYLVYAGILAVFGQTPAGIHVGLMVANAAAVVLMLLVGVRLLGAVGGTVASAAYAILSLSPRLLFPTAYAEHFVVVLVLAGVLALTATGGRRHVAVLLVAGLLFGAAFLVKQSGGVFALLGLPYCLAGSRDAARSRAAAMVAFVGGAAAPLAALVLLMLVAGTFGTFWFWTFTYAYHYATDESLVQGARNLGGAVVSILATAYLPAALAALGLLALVWDRATRARAMPVGLLLVCGLVATSAGLHFRNQYFILLLPAVALLTGVAVDSVSRRLGPIGHPGLRRLIPVVLAAVPLLHLVYLERAILFTGTPHQVLRALFGLNPFAEAVEVARYIRERGSRDDRVAVIGSEPEIYFYAQRRGATGYVYTYALMEPQPYAERMQRQMIEEIEAANPRFLVFVRVWSSWLVRPESNQTIFRWFDEYQKQFDRVGFIEILSAGQTRYLWGQTAATATPGSDRWVAVYERRAAPVAHERIRP